MALQVLYANDSLIHDLRRINRPGLKTLCLSADTLGQIEKVSGFVYYPRQLSGRVLLADSVSLMRYHAKNDSTDVAAPASVKSTEAPRPVLARPLSRIKSAS